MTLPPFHISVPVTDLINARKFYRELLGCEEGRSKSNRIDFNFFGHHLVTHVEPNEALHESRKIPSGDGEASVRHFGVVLPPNEWNLLANRLKKDGSAKWVVPPKRSNVGKVNESFVMLLDDGCGNTVEFKGQPSEAMFRTETQAD